MGFPGVDRHSRHRFLEPIHNVKEGLIRPISAAEAAKRFASSLEKSSRPLCRSRGCDGGASRDRTDDLKLAKLALSQLSYGPHPALAVVGRVGVEPTTSRLSGVRSNHLSYRPRSRPAGLLAAGGVCQL